MPPAWKAVAPWLSVGALRSRPQPAGIQRGAEALVDHLQSYRCVPDSDVLAALADR